MEQNWREHLSSDDPQQRARIIRQLAESGRAEYLSVLKAVVENDPDPQVQEYARRAARYLYTSLQAKAPAKPEPTPERAPAQPESWRQKPPAARTPAAPAPNGGEIPQSIINESESLVQRAYSLHASGKTQKALPVFAKALELNPEIVKQTFTRSVASELTGKHPDEALRILQTPSGWKEFIETPEKKAGRGTPAASQERERPPSDHQPVGLVQAWLSFFGMTEDFFLGQLEKANHEDTLVSVLAYTISAVVIFLINGFLQLQQITALVAEQIPELGFNFGMLFFGLLVGTVILTPLGFYATVGIQYLGVRLFGGVGDFKTHAYLMGLVQVPATILGGAVSLLSLVPIIGILAGLAGFGLSIYTIMVTIRLVKAAHNVTSGRAIAGIIVPPLALAFLGGCLLMTVGSSLIGLLTGLQ